ncbi:hypothetical protein CMI37_04500 [Candidatus Pacearchaeota archaeon]|nr:hypothetical protein [Candidatus Pacearchaeota archaeon]
MATTGQALRLAIPYLEQMPDGVYFDASMISGRLELSMQARTLADLGLLRDVLPVGVWKRTWRDYAGSWEYTMDCEELRARIYAVKENPAQCTAITETRVVSKKVATEWKDQEVEEEVIVGWNCGGHKEGEEELVGSE